MEALSRISELEHDGSSLKNLMQCMQDMRATLVRHQQSHDPWFMLLKFGKIMFKDLYKSI